MCITKLWKNVLLKRNICSTNEHLVYAKKKQRDSVRRNSKQAGVGLSIQTGPVEERGGPRAPIKHPVNVC